MPWKETTPMKERIYFLRDYERSLFNFTELCEVYSISRKTGYKWLKRFAQEGLTGLADRSRAPKSCPHRTDPALAEMIVDLKKKHPSWGPSKLITILQQHHPDRPWPSATTAHNILDRNDLVHHRRRRPRSGHPGRP